MNRTLAIVAILFPFELAIFLIIVPWSTLWETNALFSYAPNLGELFLHTTFRAVVTGLGVLNLLIGVSEVCHFLRPRYPE
jgi:hypothetical protein